MRALGVGLLGAVALDDRSAQAILVSHLVLETDRYEAVRRALAQAIGDIEDQRFEAVLLHMTGDHDLAVRIQAIGSLSIYLDEPPPGHPVVERLVKLLSDPSAQVRDWTAFTLGGIKADSPELRAALRPLLEEEDTENAYPAAEAAYTLAALGDPTVVAAVNVRLRRPHPGKLWLTIAANLGDFVLTPALLGLRADDNEPDDPWVQELEAAIEHCSAGTPRGW